MPKNITATKVAVLLLKDERGEPVGVVIRNGHWVFYAIDEMNDDAISALFEREQTQK